MKNITIIIINLIYMCAREVFENFELFNVDAISMAVVILRQPLKCQSVETCPQHKITILIYH